MKTDITKLGKDPDTKLPMYAYRYKGDPKSYPKVVGPMAQDVQDADPDAVKKVGKDGKLAIKVKGYAAGSPFVGQPPLTSFIPPSSPGVAKGIGAMSAFRPQVRLPRGVGVPKIQKFAFGSADVQAPDMNDVALGDQIAGGDTFGDSARAAYADKIRKLGGDASKMAGGGGSGAAPAAAQMPPGWGAPSMGYFQSGFANGVARVPGTGSGDTVPAMLTPDEAVLTGPAADHLGRQNIARLNAFPASPWQRDCRAPQPAPRAASAAREPTPRLGPKWRGA